MSVIDGIAFGPFRVYAPGGAWDPRWSCLLLGEAPNRWMEENGAPHNALLRPDLAEMCGLDLATFRATFARANLLAAWPGHQSRAGRPRGSAWPLSLARERGAEARAAVAAAPPRRLILVGTRVAHAVAGGRPILWERPRVPGPVEVVVVPHPSGASSWWNDPAHRALASAWWRALVERVRADGHPALGDGSPGKAP